MILQPSPPPSLTTSYKDFYPVYHDYIKPLGKAAFLVIVEVIKCVAAKYFLELSIFYLFSEATKVKLEVKLAYSIVRAHVVLASVWEEFDYRLVRQQGLRVLQKGWNRFIVSKKPSEYDLKIQKGIRIFVTALLFSLSHYKVASTPGSNLRVLGYTFFSGVNYGYLGERYNTLSLSILAHGFNNLIVQCAWVGKISHPAMYVLVAVNQIAVFALHHYR